MSPATTTTAITIAEDLTPSGDKCQLARIQYVEPETSADPWDCGYFAVPKTKEVFHAIRPLHDLRPEIFSPSNPYQLSTHAFTALKHKSQLDIAGGEGFDKEKTFNVMIPEIKEILKSVTGCKTVHVLGLAGRMKEPDPDATPLRDRDPNAPPERCGIDLKLHEMDMKKPYIAGYTGKDNIGPARSAHIDYSPNGARQILRHVRSDVVDSARDIIEAEDAAVAAGKDITEYDGRRYGMFSVWRPLRKVVRDPVGVCDPNTIDFERDLVEFVNKQPSDKDDYVAGVSMLRGDHADTQDWYWISEQDIDEVFIFQFYDSYAIREGRPWGAPHCGQQLIGVEGGALRLSVEARCVAVW